MTVKKKPATKGRAPPTTKGAATPSIVARMRANRLPRGAGLMFLFCDAVDNGTVPDAATMRELAALFRAAIEAVRSGTKDRQRRIIKSLALESRRGARKTTTEATILEMQIATEVERLCRSGKLVKAAEIEVAQARAIPRGTVHDYRVRHGAAARGQCDFIELADRVRAQCAPSASMQSFLNEVSDRVAPKSGKKKRIRRL